MSYAERTLRSEAYIAVDDTEWIYTEYGTKKFKPGKLYPYSLVKDFPNRCECWIHIVFPYGCDVGVDDVISWKHGLYNIIDFEIRGENDNTLTLYMNDDVCRLFYKKDGKTYKTVINRSELLSTTKRIRLYDDSGSVIKLPYSLEEL